MKSMCNKGRWGGKKEKEEKGEKKTKHVISQPVKIFHNMVLKPPYRRLLNVRINLFSGRRYGDLCFFFSIFPLSLFPFYTSIAFC